MILLILLQLSLINSLNNSVDLWLNSDISAKQMLVNLDQEEKQLKENESFDYSYGKSIINFYKGQVYFYDDEKKDSIKYLELAILYAEKANSIKETSDNWRIISESGSYMMLQKGITYIIKNSKAVNDNALKALELDNNNHRASIIVANGFINAPKLFGGDINRGINILMELNLNNVSREVRFNRLFTLARAYKQNKKRDLAITYCEKSLKIYPGNNAVKELLLSLKR